MGIKDMIARCIARMRQGDCATCDNRDSCAIHKMGAFNPPPKTNPFASLFSEVAGALVAAVERPSGFRRKIEGRIEVLLETGEARIDRVASDMGEDTTFEDLLDKVRHRLALRYLREDRMSVKAASYRLGFSEPAAFSRAFKRWTGASPRAAMA